MSEQFLATASVRIVPDVTGFAAALQAEVTAATRAVRIPAASTSAATAAAAGSAAALTSATRVLSVEQKELANVFGAVAASAKLESVALKEQAVSAGQAARGLATATASQFGLRGAVLASSGPFLAAVVAVETVKKSVEELSAEQEAAARVTAILGERVGKSTEEWAHQQAAMGLSAAAALKYAGAIEQVFKNVGVSDEENAKFSEDLVTRAADVAARSNRPVTEVLRAFQLALSGNLRGLRQFVPAVDAATIAQRAMADTGKRVKSELTTQELVLARNEIIMQKSANQAGAFAERSGDLAGQTKILTSNVANLAAEFGKLATPALSGVAATANLAFLALEKVKDLLGAAAPPTKDAADHTTLFGRALNFLKPAAEGSLSVLAETDKIIESFLAHVPPATTEFSTLAEILGNSGASATILADDFRGLIDPINAATLAVVAFKAEMATIGAATSAITNATNKLLAQEIQGASSAERIATLQAKAAAAQSILGALGGPRGARGRAALQTKAAAVSEIKSIQAADAAAAKSAASAAESAAKQAAAAAEAARRQHDQDIQNANDQLQFTVDLAHLKAQRTKSLVDDLAADRLELTIIDKKIANASKILDATTRLQTLEGLTLDKERARQQIATDRAAQAARRKEHRDLLRDRASQILELNIELASTNKNISAEVAAREARIRFDQEQIKSVHGDVVRKKQLQLEIAQDTQALKDLRKAQKENAGLADAAQFQFLTTQAGFAANLLGNLIPRSAAVGTVGGGAISTPTVPRPATALSAAAQTAGGPRGASTGQMATLIHVQMQMLQAILRLTGQRAHPESTYQRYTAADDLNVATST